jgi:hypothetical protein
MSIRRYCLRLSLTLTLLPLCAASTRSAPPNIDWFRKIGTPEGERFGGFALDHDGHAFVAGTTNGSLAAPANLYDDAFLAEYTTDGQFKWVRQFGIGSTSAHGVAADPQGNAYVTGQTTSSVGIPYFPAEDAFVTKYDVSGNLQWYRQIGTSYDEIGEAIAADGRGNVYLAGYTNGPLNGQPFNNAADAILVKLHDDGTVAWTREFGDYGDDVAWAVAADALGNVYVSGYTANQPPGFSSNYDAFLRKYNTDGNLTWSRKFGTPKYEQVESLAIDATGNVYLGGTTDGNLAGTDPSPGGAFIAKFTPDGATEWLRQYMQGAAAVALAVDSQNNLYATTGLTSSTLISKLDAQGNLVWDLPTGTTPDTVRASTWSAAVDANDRLYLSGSSPEYPTIPGLGYADLFVIKIGNVPEPAPIALALFAAIPANSYRRRLPRRTHADV